MIKIAFCDDDMEVLHQMNELIDRYRVERNEDITYAAFQSPFELLTEIEKGIRPDILFLDVDAGAEWHGCGKRDPAV